MHAWGVFRPSQLPTSRSRPNQALQVWQHDDEECMHAGNEPLAVREREAGMVAFTQFVAHERGGGASGGSEAGVVCRLRELTPSTLSSKPPSRAGGHTTRTAQPRNSRGGTGATQTTKSWCLQHSVRSMRFPAPQKHPTPQRNKHTRA